MSQGGIVSQAAGTGVVSSSVGASTDNAAARWDGAGGQTIQNSGLIISDAVAVTGATQLDVDNLRLDGNTISAIAGAITITPFAGSAINLDDTNITADGGVFSVTGQINIDNLRLDGNTLSSTAGAIAIGPLAGQNVDVTAAAVTFDGISAGFANSSTRWMQAGVQTTDATQTTIASITVATNEAVCVEARIIGMRDDFSACCGGTVLYTARNAGAGAIEASVPLIETQEDSAGAPALDADVSGNDVRLRITGLAAQNWNWVADYRYTTIRTNA